MSKNQDIGNQGEDLAVLFLESSGHVILERNWRFSKAEVDIICKKDDQLIFVEVKTRSYNYYGAPAEFVTSKKESLMIDAAHAYMNETGYEWKIRFDIISVLLDQEGEHQIEHVEDAFFPGW